jgi:hypothetical protein
MSQITINIIASCTDRKRAPVDGPLLLRNVVSSNVEERANLWWDRLKTNRGPTVIASELYAGAHWSAVRNLPEIGRTAGYHAKLWVISAGYGLVSADSFLHPYSATFARTNSDAVCLTGESALARRDCLQTWWSTLGDLKRADGVLPPNIAELAAGRRGDYFLFIASPDYLSAVGADLIAAASQLYDPQRLIIVSSNGGAGLKSLEAHTVPSDARLQSTVGGVLGSLHARVASLILENVGRWGFTAKAVRARLLEMMEAGEAPKRYNRESMDDAAVRAFVREAMDRTPRPSCTSLLRELRKSGRACEQKRFKNLYNDVRLEGTLFSPKTRAG